MPGARAWHSRRDGHLQHPVALVAEKLVRRLDVVELEAVRHHRAKVDASGGNHRHEAAHALLAVGHNVVMIRWSPSPAANGLRGIVKSVE